MRLGPRRHLQRCIASGHARSERRPAFISPAVATACRPLFPSQVCPHGIFRPGLTGVYRTSLGTSFRQPSAAPGLPRSRFAPHPRARTRDSSLYLHHCLSWVFGRVFVLAQLNASHLPIIRTHLESPSHPFPPPTNPHPRTPDPRYPRTHISPARRLDLRSRGEYGLRQAPGCCPQPRRR